MGLPAIETEILFRRFAEGFKNAKAPYYGVNIIDVNRENWDAFIEGTKAVHKGVREVLGGRSHFWAVRDFGDRKRVVWINYYPECVAEKNSYEAHHEPERLDLFLEYCKLIERYEWFITSEDPSETPTATSHTMGAEEQLDAMYGAYVSEEKK